MNDNIKKYLVKLIIRFLKENNLYKPSYIKTNVKNIDDVINEKNTKLNPKILIDIESLLSIVTMKIYDIYTIEKLKLRTTDVIYKYYDFLFNIIGNQYRKENVFMNFLNSNKKIYNTFFNNISKQSWNFVNKLKKHRNDNNLPTNMEYVILLNLMVNEEEFNTFNTVKIFKPMYEKWMTYYYTYVNNIQINENN